MKKLRLRVSLIVVFVVLLTFVLTACNSDLFVPQTVTIDKTTYRDGFYGDLIPNNITFKGDAIKVGDKEFHHINYEKFDWVHSAIGSFTEGTLYCSESQWEQVCEYYADSDNFVYYCSIGAEYVDRDPVIITIPDIDFQKFDELMSFAEKNNYNPFRSNKGVKTLRVPIPDRDKSPELIFYKESIDGFFTSDKEYKFHELDGKLLLVFYYDYGDGENEEMVAVNVPDELGQYFIKLLE